MESLPPLAPLSGTRRKEQLSCGGAASRCAFLFTCTHSEGQERGAFIGKRLERSRENQTPSVFSGGWSSSFWYPPQVPHSLKNVSHEAKKVLGSLLPCSPTFSLSLLSFFSLEPSEKHQETEVSALSYDRSLVL